MKKLLYLTMAIVALGSCQKTNPAPTTNTPVIVTPTIYPTDIQYVTSTYENFDLSYTLDKQYNTIIDKNSKIVLTYIPGDSVHFELITNAPLNHKSETLVLCDITSAGDNHGYTFKTGELEVFVYLQTTGIKSCMITYYGNDDQRYNTGVIVANK